MGDPINPIKNYTNVYKYSGINSNRLAGNFIAYNKLRMDNDPYPPAQYIGYFNGIDTRKQLFVGKMNWNYAIPYTNGGYGTHNTDYGVGGMTVGASYYGLSPLTVPVIMYVETKSIGEVLENSGYYYPVTGDYVENKTVIKSPATPASSFLSTFSNFKIITNITFYDNSNNNLSNLHPREFLGYANEQRVNYNSFDIWSRLVSYNNSDYTFGEFDVLMPLLATYLWGVDKTSFRGGCAEGIYSSVQPSHMFTFLNSTNGDLAGTKVSGAQNFYHIFDSLSAITNVLNQIGVPFTYNQNEAITSPTQDFPDYKPTGQGTDTSGGGTGNGDNDSEDITNTNPDTSLIGVFNKHYAMSEAMMNSLSDYLWTANFLDNIKLLFNSPSEGIISCRLFPFSFPTHDSAHVGSPQDIQIGNVVTSVSGFPVLTGYNCKFDMGALEISEYYGSALDYEPYTSIELYLPYIGIKALSTNDVMGKTIHVYYIVDITTGACIAEVFSGEQLLYTYEGKIGVDIPISSTNASQLASNLALAGVTGMAGTITGVATANPVTVAGSVLSMAKSVASSQFHINKGGLNSPMASFFMPQTCYVIISRPIQSLASTFGAAHGFPCNASKLLSTVTGYTECENPVLTSIVATEEEKQEIIKLLESGVIFA